MINRLIAVMATALCFLIHCNHAELDNSELRDFFLQQEGAHEWGGFGNIKARLKKQKKPLTKEELIQDLQSTCINWTTEHIEQKTEGQVINSAFVQKLTQEPDLAFAISKCSENHDCKWREFLQAPVATVRSKWDEDRSKKIRYLQAVADQNREHGNVKVEIVCNLARENLQNGK